MDRYDYGQRTGPPMTGRRQRDAPFVSKVKRALFYVLVAAVLGFVFPGQGW